MLATKITALLALCAGATMAADVYSSFLDDNGDTITDTNYDVGNPGCFSVGPAYQVAFSQAGIPGQEAQGPYCLFAWDESGCSGDYRARQQFQDVVPGGTKYTLNSGISAAGSYRWQATACS